MRRKYCSERCANRFYARQWRKENAAKNAAYQKVYFKKWLAKNKAKLAAYQKKYRAGRGKGNSTKWARANREKIVAKRRVAYRDRNAEFRAKERVRKARKMREEFSLLAIAIASRTSTDSAKPPPA